MKSLKLGLFVFIVFLLSCEEGDIILPKSNGRPGQVLVIMSNNKWEGEAGKTMKKYLLKEVPALPQPENQFDLSQMPNDAFNKMVSQEQEQTNGGSGHHPAVRLYRGQFSPAARQKKDRPEQDYRSLRPKAKNHKLRPGYRTA